jgi:ATP-dependent Lhr-like helicase
LLEAAVLAACGRAAQLEALTIPSHPLDVLCQHLLGMAATRQWSPREALALVRRAYPYCNLAEDDFQACLAYLSGKGQNDEAWLPSRLRWQGERFTLLDDRTARLVRRNLGTIISEQSRPVLLCTSASEEARLGELGEPFADRLAPGSYFLLDGRSLRVDSVEGFAIRVAEVPGRPAVPKWGSEVAPLSRELAARLYLLRTQAAEALREGPDAMIRQLEEDYGLGPSAAQRLLDYFRAQECLSEIPDRGGCLIEALPTLGGVDYYVYTPLNRAGNDALARVAARRLARDHAIASTSIVADLGFLLHVQSTRQFSADEFRQLLSADKFHVDLAQAISGSSLLRQRFRRVALTGLMLLRNLAGRRRRVGGVQWEERRLFERVQSREPEFVLLRQATREVRDECCDAAAAAHFLVELPRLSMRVRWLSHVSPFADGWSQTAIGPVEIVGTHDDALKRFHAYLTRTQGNDASPYRLAANA